LEIKKAASSSSESEEESSSDSEEEKPVAKAKPAAAPVKKAAAATSSSSDSDEESSSASSDDDEEEEEEEKEVAKKPAKKAAPPVAKTAPAAAGDEGGDVHKIFVKGLPWTAVEQEVRDFFADCGSIVQCELPLAEGGRSSGTAFVTFAARAGLDAALSLDGQTWPETERWLKIQEATVRPDRRFMDAAPGARPDGCDTVFVGNLPWDVTEEQMREIFGAAGEISSVRFAMNQEDGTFRGFGHVSFYAGEDAEAAVKLAGTQLSGRGIRVDYAPPRERKSFGGGESGGGGGRGRGRGDSSPGGRGGRGGGGGGFGGRGGGRGGRGGTPTAGARNKGFAVGGSGKKTSFD
jgi:nucleolin